MSNTQKPFISDNGVAVLSGLIKGATEGKLNADLSNVDLEVLAAKVNEAGISGGGLEGGLYVDEEGALYFDSKPVSGGGAMSEEVETRFSLIEDDLSDVGVKVDDLETGVSALEASVSNLSGTVSGVDTKATTNAQNITNLTSRIAAAEGKVATTATATIGTSWTEDSTTGVKTQTVSISGVTASDNAKVDVRYTGNGTSDSYTTFVEQQTQFLNCITNGFAETVAGGIKFTIFGDANTVSIPIFVEVI